MQEWWQKTVQLQGQETRRDQKEILVKVPE